MDQLRKDLRIVYTLSKETENPPIKSNNPNGKKANIICIVSKVNKF